MERVHQLAFVFVNSLHLNSTSFGGKTGSAKQRCEFIPDMSRHPAPIQPCNSGWFKCQTPTGFGLIFSHRNFDQVSEFGRNFSVISEFISVIFIIAGATFRVDAESCQFFIQQI